MVPVSEVLARVEPSELVALTRDLVRIPSVVQPGDPARTEAPVAAFIRDHLFSPFRTTKGEGYGIGAFESREFARQAGGRLEVESSPGKGTVMRLVLPATPPQPIASPTVDAKVDVSHERA